MAYREKTSKRRPAERRTARKGPAWVRGVVVSVVGILLIIISLAPASLGAVGRWVHDNFLFVVFGTAAIVAGVYCLGCGLALLVARNKWRYIAGLTCWFLPALVMADAWLSGTPETAAKTKYALPIGHLLRSAGTDFIGGAGLVMLSSALLLAGTFLVMPRRVLAGLWNWIRIGWEGIWSRSHPSQSKSTAAEAMQNQAQDVPPTTPAQAGTPPHARSEIQCAVEPKPFQLKLERYNREFVKVPTGLFEQQTSLNTSLAAGTRRQEIIDAFALFHLDVDIGDIKRGPSFEQYELIPGKGVKITQIRNCVEDVSLRLRQKVMIGKKTNASVTIEVPLAERQVVPYGFILEDKRDDALAIPIAVGVDASFTPFSVDLVELPHLLIAGATGSGKSIFLKTLIASILYHLTPDEARLVLIDPKRVEFGVFSSSLFCACEVITDFEDIAAVFEAIVLEMEKRYELLEHAGVSDLRQYNAGVEPRRRQPYIVVVVDEFADLLMQNLEGFENRMIRLAQKARASGIHLVLATQRPSADVIKGLLKANIPGRIAFSVSSQVDSKIILDMGGAENLTGKGDLICICPAFRDGIRLQGAYITNEEIQRIIATKS
jgi:hypothetical protein